MQKYITVKGAHEHNLKNVSVKIPINRISVVTGLSGSGKSSLVIDTISTEGKRRYIETFSSYARQFFHPNFCLEDDCGQSSLQKNFLQHLL